MKIKFCGAAMAVTGSCYLINFEGGNILVDCGMRQGADAKSEYGASEFAFDPASINAVLITHAHIDHTGLIPLLVKRGYAGPIFATTATARLGTIMLPDSAHIQEQDAEYETRKNLRAGKPPAEPMYTMQDAENALKYFKPVHYQETVDVFPGIKARFTDVGHLLGSSAIEIWVEEKGKTTHIAFSGDIGQKDQPILNDPQSVQGADYLIMESTYGDRDHQIRTETEKEMQFAQLLKEGIARGGNIVIPSFAIGRTQELLYYIKRFLRNGTVPGLERVPVYVDSPLGIRATQIYASCEMECYDDEAKAASRSGDMFEFSTLRIAETADESKLINTQKESHIVISSSGMCDAGRIRHHLKHNLYRADSTVIFVGYQAIGTLGRLLVDGAKKVKMFGEQIMVNATIESIDGFSGHADKSGILEWLQGIPKKPGKIFLVHGERKVIKSFAVTIRGLGYDVVTPEPYEEFDLLTGGMQLPETVGSPVVLRDRAQQLTDTVAELRRLMHILVDASSGDANRFMPLEADIKALADEMEGVLNKKQG